jgi:hypothetical protein
VNVDDLTSCDTTVTTLDLPPALSQPPPRLSPRPPRFLVAACQLLVDVRLACRGQKRGQPVVMLDDVVDGDACRNLARPPHEQRDAERAPQLEFFSFRNGVIAASGQVFMCGPLSVLYITIAPWRTRAA